MTWARHALIPCGIRDYRIVGIISLIFPLFIKGFLASVLMLTNEVIHRIEVHVWYMRVYR